MSKSEDIFPLIGPHEGREFELLDAGEKHVAYFYEIIPEEYYAYREFDEYSSIEWSRSAVHSETVETVRIPFAILFRKTHKKQAERLEQICRNRKETYHPSQEYEIGEILGYPKEAINFFAERAIKSWKKKAR